VWKGSEGYVSKCPELGVASCGDSFEDAVTNLREAVELYLEKAKELKKNIQRILKQQSRDKISVPISKTSHDR